MPVLRGKKTFLHEKVKQAISRFVPFSFVISQFSIDLYFL